MSAFHRLHPHLQHAIVHDLGWRSLRPVQEQAVEAILDGANAVVLAPTAGGKTEASMFPLLSRILTEQIEPVSVLYICPIRALLNNQEERLARYAGMVGLSSFKWHGDVGESKRKRFRASPAHLLLTTPESIEVMMISARTDARDLFKNLSAVVIDEVHAFAGDDRGAHLAALLERLTRLCGRDIQRIGLSATVGNPLQIGEWLQGSSEHPFRLVDPPRPKVEPELRVDLCDTLGEAASRIGRIASGRKSLVFVESRAKAERVAHSLGESDVEVFIHHGSVGRAERALAEERFFGGSNTAIVCTSTMELGIDVGDLDRVIQIDAPSSVASFMQRMGRTGRRPGTVPNASFFCLSAESLLQAVALLRLAERGWVESVRPPVHAMHILAHQVLALTLQEGGVSRHAVLDWVRGAFPFAGIRDERVTELLDTMVARDIVYEADGLLSLGQQGECTYGRKNFFELYAVFSSPPLLRVLHGRDEIGTVQAFFVLAHDRDRGPLCFRLAGQAWQVTLTELSRGILRVRKADRGAVPNWLGLPGVLSRELCLEMKRVLLKEGSEAKWLTQRALDELGALRDGYAGLFDDELDAPLERGEDDVAWHTFAGGAINRLLAAALETITECQWVPGNLSVRSKEAGFASALDAVGQLPRLDWEDVATETAGNLVRGTVSKFQPCLPEAAENRLLAERLLDVAGTVRFLAQVQLSGKSLAALPTGLRLQERGVAVRLPKVSLTRPSSTEADMPKNPVVWIGNAADLSAACELLSSEPLVGLDVETGLDFKTLCLIQLATPRQTFLIDALALTPKAGPLRHVLESGSITKVIHNASFERRVLAGVGVRLAGVFDTLKASRKTHGYRTQGGHSLAVVCHRELGVAIDKGEQTSNWARRPLSESQLRYAALDAEILLRLHQRLGKA